MVKVWRRIWRWVAGTFAAVVIVLALLIGGFRLFLSQTPEYADDIERWASDTLGVQVEIGTLDARWGFAGPEISFTDTKVTQDQQTLVLAKRGRVAISVFSLFRGELQPSRIILEDTTVEVRRSEDGVVALAGQNLPRADAEPGSGEWRLSESLPQGVFELREATIKYLDMKDDKSFVFEDVSLKLTNESKVISLKGDIGRLGQLGETVTFAIDTTEKFSNDRRWRLHIDAKGMDLPSWMTLSGLNELGLTNGVANAKLSAAFVGDRVELANGVFAFNQLELLHQKNTQSYPVIRGKLDWDRISNGWRITLSEFLLDTGERRWDPVRMSFELTTTGQDDAQIAYGDAEYVNLSDLAPLFARVPFEPLQNVLADLNPRGEFEDVLFNASRRDGQLTSYSLRTAFAGAGMDANGAIPGFDNLNGYLRLDSSGGNLQLDSTNAGVNIPKVFRWPFAFDQIKGDLDWRNDPSGITLQSKDFLLNNPDVKASTTFRLVLPSDGSIPTLELRADAREAYVSKAKPYLPKVKIKPNVLAWLDQALVSGYAPEGVVTFNGPVKGFPFDQGQGEFKAVFSVQDLVFDYAENWPALTKGYADVEFHNAELTIDIDRGEVSGNPVADSGVRIGDLRQGVVEIDGKASSELPQLLDFLRSSPIGKAFGPQLSDMSMTGRGNTEFNVVFPAKARETTTVKGYLDLDAEEIRLEGLPHSVQSVKGRLGFSQESLQANQVQGTLLGSPVSLDIIPSVTDDGTVNATLLVAKGSINQTALQEQLGAPPDWFQGSTEWRCIVRFPREFGEDAQDVANIIVESNFDGMAVNLPEPFRLAADETKNTSLELRFVKTGEIDTEFSLANDVRAVGSLTQSPEGQWGLARANLNFGPDLPALTSTDRLVVSGQVSTLDVDAWLGLDTGGGGAPLQDIFRSINLKADTLNVLGQSFDAVSVKLDHNVREWLVQVEGERIDGSVFVPFDPDNSGPIIVDLTKLYLPENEDSDEPQTEVADESVTDPRSLTALQLKIADFAYGSMRLGEVQANIEKEPLGLRLVSLQTNAPSFQSDASGHWLYADGLHRTQFDLKLVSTDVAATMNDLGYGDSISADDAEVTLNLNWNGPPVGNLLERMSGSGSVGVSKGQLTSVKPKAGRVFGLLSVAALPRRLSLDFRDVFDKGLGFDSISGDFSFENGNAWTNNLVLAGPAADVGIVGRTGLVEKDYDQTAVVSADIGNSLPIAGALVAGPGAGAALLVFSRLFKKPLKQIAAVQYRITGSWEEPTIEQLGNADRQDNAG